MSEPENPADTLREFRSLLEQVNKRLELSESIVTANLQQLYAKAHVRTRSQLARFALENLRGRL